MLAHHREPRFMQDGGTPAAFSQEPLEAWCGMGEAHGFEVFAAEQQASPVGTKVLSSSAVIEGGVQ